MSFVLRVEQQVANPVKAISKDTLGWTLMFFDSNGFDLVQPSPYRIGPAKSNREASKKPIEAFFVFQIDGFKVKASRF